MTHSGRLACTDPPVNTYPPKARAIFVAPEGYELGYYDNSTVEFRFLVYGAKDEKALEALRLGGDVHRRFASLLFKKRYDDVTPMERFLTKFVVFGVGYGREAPSIAESYNIPLSEAQFVFNTFFEEAPRVRPFQDGEINHVRNNGWCGSYYGRRRYFMDCPRVNGVWALADDDIREIRSHYPQASAHDYFMEQVADVWEEGELSPRPVECNVCGNTHTQHKWDIHPIGDFHDGLLVEQPVGFDSGKIKEIMERERIPGLKIPVGVKVGRTFGELDDR
jgi:hypothetical protein